MQKGIVYLGLATMLGLGSMVRADVLNLFPPPPLTQGDSAQGQDIGDFGIGVVFTANSTFSITDAAIQFNPFASKTPNIQSVIYSATASTRAITYTPAGCNPNNPNTIPGNCTAYAGTNVPVGLATSGITSIVDSGQQFYDTVIPFTFTAGQTYAIEFFANVDQSGTDAGWGTGANNTERNLMTLWEWDPAIAGDNSFTVGPLTVLDGAYVGDGGALNRNFPAVQLGVVPEPRMIGAVLGGIALLLMACRRLPAHS